MPKWGRCSNGYWLSYAWQLFRVATSHNFRRKFSTEYPLGALSATLRCYRRLGRSSTRITARGFQPKESWGPRIEDRGTQITYSALGQQAPLDAKEQWDPDFRKRQKIKALLDPMLPNFSVRLGGTTSIDVTRAGVDKGYGIRKLRDVLGIPIERMLFVGDAIFPGGNDYAAMQAGAPSIKVRDPEDTKRVIETIVAWST
jgi:phosphomannomutase